MEVGELCRFDMTSSIAISRGMMGGRLHGKTFIYLGEDFIHRDDGVTVENHKVLYTGETSPSIIDRSLLKYIRPLDLERK